MTTKYLTDVRSIATGRQFSFDLVQSETGAPYTGAVTKQTLSWPISHPTSEEVMNLVEKTPSICGGRARLRGTRIPIWVLVNFRRLGASDVDVSLAYPNLRPYDLEAAWLYAAANEAEIARDIEENEAGDEGPVE